MLLCQAGTIRGFTQHSEYLIYKVTINPEPSNMLLCQAGNIRYLHDTVSIL